MVSKVKRRRRTSNVRSTARIGYRARLTSKYQATVPKEIRKRLHLRKGDQILYELLPDDTVVVRKSSPVDWEYLQALNSTMNEWASTEDEQAYKNL